MASFNDLPPEIIIEIFSYLSRKDRISCSNVCAYWRQDLNSPSLWKNIVVHLDSDLSEPSTELATKLYHVHFKAMEFCWANPRLPARWMQHGLQEFSKRACRYIMILQDSYVQLNSVKVVDWYEIPRFKKIIYHLSKFLRSQQHLVKVTFFNANFNKVECIKLLAACLGSTKTLNYLDISNCSHVNRSSNYESVAFMGCLEQLSNLRVLKLDYSALSEGLMDALIISKNKELKFLDMFVREHAHFNSIVPEIMWKTLQAQCPMLKVGVYFINVCHFEDINPLLSSKIPLTTFSISCGRTWDQSRSRQYRKTVDLLLKNYCNILENVCFYMTNNREIIDDLILNLIIRCPNLQYFDFHGVIESIELLREICKFQTENSGIGFKYFHIVPKIVNPANHSIFSQLHKDYSKQLEARNVEFKILNASNKNLVYIYY